MRGVPIYFGQALLSGIGFIWLIAEAYYGLSPEASYKIGFVPFIFTGLISGVIWFCIDGFFVSGFLRKAIEITSNAIDTRITISVGDLFKKDGFRAISVNDFFDSAVDEKHVASSSLHGVVLTRYWAGNSSDWDTQVARELAGIQPTEIITARPPPGKQRRYALGTTVAVNKDGNDFLCVAMSRTNIENLQTFSTSEQYQRTIRQLLCKARTVCAGKPLNIPLMGSGLSRTGIKQNIIVDLILLAIFEESKDRKITDHIRIILHKNMSGKIDLTTIQKNWR